MPEATEYDTLLNQLFGFLTENAPNRWREIRVVGEITSSENYENQVSVDLSFKKGRFSKFATLDMKDTFVVPNIILGLKNYFAASGKPFSSINISLLSSGTYEVKTNTAQPQQTPPTAEKQQFENVEDKEFLGTIEEMNQLLAKYLPENSNELYLVGLRLDDGLFLQIDAFSRESDDAEWERVNITSFALLNWFESFIQKELSGGQAEFTVFRAHKNALSETQTSFRNEEAESVDLTSSFKELIELPLAHGA